MMLVILSSIFLNGCLTTSFNPLFKKSDLVTKEELVGKWIGKNTLLTFEKQNESSYLLNYKSCEDPYNAPNDYSSCTVADFTAYLMKLGDDYFLDFLPKAYLSTENVFLKLHIRATHSFAKVVIEKETLKVFFIDYEWVADYIEKNEGALDYIKSDDLVTLTATTEELQEFVLKHQEEPGFFINPIILKRKIMKG